MFLLGLIAIAVAALSGPGRTSAQRTEAPSAVRDVRVVGASALPGSVVAITVELESGGDEVAGSFTINFDPAKLSPAPTPFVALGTGVPAGTALTVNPNQTAIGRVGMLFDSTNTFTISPPNRHLVTIRFTVAANAPAGPTPITFGNTPTPRSFSDTLGNPITMVYVDGSVTIQAAAPPVNVSGRVTTSTGRGIGNALVTMVDANSVRRAATTSTFGYYSFSGVPSGLNYTISVTARRFTFTPVVMMITTDLTNLDFVGS